ncbi:MAG: transposase, partial [Acidimicrobiia bacterium]
ELVHPLTRHIYRLTEDGLVEVEDPADGRRGIFDHDGNWRSGELRSADPHMAGWVGRLAQRGKGPS